MRASSVALEGHKVKLTVEVNEDEFQAVQEDTMLRLTAEARLPGFRPGKVPRRVLEARLGRKAIREQVIAEALPRYYDEAVEDQQLDVIAQPEIDVTAGTDAGPLVFDAVVEVRPQVEIPGYQGLAVTLGSPEPTEEEIDAQVDRLREQFATLTDVERPAADSDVLTIDVHVSRDGKPVNELDLEDQTYELGSGSLAPGADEQLAGTKAGDIVSINTPASAGGELELKVLVKRVREKVLPAADDAFASDASEFDTLAELRADLRSRLERSKRLQANVELRERAIEALVALVAEDPPESLVAHERDHLVASLLSRLERQRVRLGDYLAATGRDEDGLLAELEEQARRQVKADLALRALASAESLEVDESDLDEEIVRIAGQAGRSPAEVRDAFERDGRLAGLRSDLRNAKALAWLEEHVGVEDDEGNPIDRSALLLEDAGRGELPARADEVDVEPSGAAPSGEPERGDARSGSAGDGSDDGGSPVAAEELTS